jgi:hypothetical protein
MAALTEDNLRCLTDAGLASVIMSIDAHERSMSGIIPSDVVLQDQTRQRILQRCRHPDHREHHCQPPDRGYDRLPPFSSLGFPTCTSSHPLTALGSTYLSFSNSGLVNYTRDELLGVFERIKAMKRKSAPGGQPHESPPRCSATCAASRRSSGASPVSSISTSTGSSTLPVSLSEKLMCNIYEFDASKLIRRLHLLHD